MRVRLLRRLYDWVLHWAATPYGAPALLVLAFAESSFFPVPPDILLLALCLALPARSFHYALLATAGSVIGGVVGYGIGSVLWNHLDHVFYRYVPGFTEAVFLRVQDLFAAFDFWTVFTAGFTPIPYKVITIGAGVFEINFPVFVLASLSSRGLRFFILAWLMNRYGAPMREFIERYFNVLSLLLMAALLMLLLLARFVL